MRRANDKWLKSLLNLLFPPRCTGCGRREVWLCGDCISKFSKLETPICRICGHPTGGTQMCSSCYKSPPRIDGIRAPYYFEGVLREAIHRFKYKRARHLAAPLASLLSDYISSQAVAADVIVPVPLHPSRERERGYNQSALLAIELGRILDLQCNANSLHRIMPTKPQIGLLAKERADNVRGAFQCLHDEFRGRKVLLVDDVCTTGATLESAAQALIKGGASSVWGFCVARARLRPRGS